MQELSYHVDPGKCADTLLVKYKNKEFAVTHPTLLFSPTPHLTVELITCFRNSPQIPDDIELQVDYGMSGQWHFWMVSLMLGPY